MGSPTTRATPLLTAFRTRARPRGESIAHADGSAFQTFLTLMGCLLPVSVCWYQAVAEPLFAVGSVEFTHPDLVASLIVLAAGGRAVVKGFGRVPRSIVITSSLFLLSTALSALVAKDTLRGFAAVLQDLEFLAILWAYSSVIDPKNFLRVIHFTLAVFVFQSLVAAGQFVTGVSMPTGTFFSHQQYAFFISVGACVAFALFASEQVGWKKFLYLITLSILVVGSLLGQERAPWLSFVLSGAVVGAYSGRKRRKVLLMGLAMTVTAAVLLVVGVPQLREVTISRIAEAEVQTESRNSLLSRFLLWGIAFKLFTENPILGIGPKNFVSVVPHYATSEEMMGSEARSRTSGSPATAGGSCRRGTH